ncbi:hypothetical protein N0V90_011649 [Kalmusia sp. IMI 367209]|nr:hypothetical protein N0V90_011649 [Kalmusia sp. IMI 367209]
MFFSALFAAIAALVLAFPSVKGIEISPPSPDGQPWRVAYNRSSLVDTSRKDPYNPSEDRKVAYSIFMPIDGGLNDVTPRDTCTGYTDNEYMPELTAKANNLQFFGDENANVFEQLSFQTCASASGETPADVFPLIIFEPAVGTSRFIYNQLARQLSANGAYVVTVDHPYDAPIVEFADADPIESNGAIALDAFKVNMPWDNTIEKAVNTRIGDINAVIKELESEDTLSKLFPGVKFVAGNQVPPTKEIFMVGHGLGGTVATSMGANDPRVKWTMNLSGSTPVIKEDTLSYTIFFGREDYRSDNDTAWQESKKHFAGPQVEWTYMSAEQFDYSDLPLVVALVDPNKEAEAKGLGTPYKVMDKDLMSTFIALSCFTEAYFRDTILPGWAPPHHGEDRDRIHRCMGWFGAAMRLRVPGQS